MNPFDIFILIVLIYCIVRGYFKGIILEISTILGVICGLYASFMYHEVMAQQLKRFLQSSSRAQSILPDWLLSESSLNLVSFALIFLLIILCVTNLGRLIKYLMKITFLGWIDRSFGVCFGFIKGVLIVSVALIVFSAFLPRQSTLIKESRLSPIIKESSEILISVVPDHMKKTFNSRLKEVKQYWNKKKKTSSA